MSNEITKPIIEAIDLGYGFTKFTITNSIGAVRNHLFPSVAAIASKKGLGAGYLKERDTITVMHDDVQYEIGQDVMLTAGGYSHRVLNDHYVQSADYHVLMKGALKKMGHDYIDILVLGAPVNKLDDVKEYLIQTWSGKINLDGEKVVKIGKVNVVPQPLGGFVYFGAQEGIYEKIRKQRNLVIDPGYFTLDWLLIDNMKVMEGSNSHQGGMSFVINAVVKELGKDANNLTTISRLDKYFYNNEPVNFKGNEINMSKYESIATSVIDKSVQTMKNSLTDIHNIDNIIVIGGAADVYLPSIARAFPTWGLGRSGTENLVRRLSSLMIWLYS